MAKPVKATARDHEANQGPPASKESNFDSIVAPESLARAMVYLPQSVHTQMRLLAVQKGKPVSDLYLEAAMSFLQVCLPLDHPAIDAARMRLAGSEAKPRKATDARGDARTSNMSFDELARTVEEQGRSLAALTQMLLARTAPLDESKVASDSRPSEPNNKPRPDQQPFRGAADATSAQSLQLSRPGAGRAARIILSALEQAGADGLPTRSLNRAVEAQGLQVRAAQKARKNLKERGEVHHDAETDRWHAAEVMASGS